MLVWIIFCYSTIIELISLKQVEETYKFVWSPSNTFYSSSWRRDMIICSIQIFVKILQKGIKYYYIFCVYIKIAWYSSITYSCLHPIVTKEHCSDQWARKCHFFFKKIELMIRKMRLYFSILITYLYENHTS